VQQPGPTGPPTPGTDDDLVDVFGPMSLARGRSYAAAGHVLEMSADEDAHTVSGLVAGSEGRRYRTTVHLAADPHDGVGPDVESYCSCPVGLDCKHGAALLIVARQWASTSAQQGDQVPEWERALAALVEPAGSTTATRPVALQFDVEQRPSRTARPTRADTPPRRIRLRPVVPGASGAWVRTGVTWQQMRFGHEQHTPAHRAALRELLLAYEIAGRAPHGTYTDAVYLDMFGPSLWRLLREAVDAGVELVTSRRSAGRVELSAEPAALTLDITAADGDAAVDAAAAADGAVLHTRLRCGDQPVDADDADLLGAPPHGLALHTGSGLLLAPLDPAVEGPLAGLLRDRRRVHVPAGDLDRFVADYYPRLQRSVPVTSSDGRVALPEVAPPRLSLTVTYHEGHRIALEWGFEYTVGATTRGYPLTGTDDQERDPAAERRLLEDLPLPDDRLTHLRSQGGPRRLLSPVILSGMDCVAFLDQALPRLEEHPGVVVHERGRRPDLRPAEHPPQVRVSATDTDDPDWFDLHVVVVVDGEEVAFDALFTALARGQSHLLLPSGVWFDLDHTELRDLRRLIEEARAMLDAESGPLRVSRYQAGFFEELQSLGVVEEQSRRWADLVEGLADAGDVGEAAGAGADPPPLPATLRATLRPYQLEGYRWLSFLWDAGLGGVLADDMGLGKTVQTLAMLCRAKETGGLDAPVLVVAPTSVVRNWVREAAEFAPDLRVVAVTETASRRGTDLAEETAGADVVVTSYALLRIDRDSHHAQTWSGLVLDEAQAVKNHQGKTYQCVRRLQAPFKLAITGTPLENNLMELWALLSIVAPGLFPSPQRFSEFYRRPIERGSDPALLASLRRRLRPLMRRRTKEHVAADLPAKQEQVLQVDLTARHRRIYDTHLQRERQKVLRLLDDLDQHRFTVLRSLTLLRQLSLDPALVDEADDGVRSAKVDVLLEHLVEVAAEGHRALVFSQFTGFLRRVRDRLDAEGLAYCYLDGGTRDRDRVIEAFKHGDAPVFLLSIKAGGFGLNLTEADYCFILDPWWNPATEAQAVDRTHRIGQDKRVVVYRLVSTDTIEQKVMALKEHKAALFSSVLSDDGSLAGPVSADDIRALLDH
jgi:superfamily II DNA or RNA helicase